VISPAPKPKEVFEEESTPLVKTAQQSRPYSIFEELGGKGFGKSRGQDGGSSGIKNNIISGVKNWENISFKDQIYG